MRRQRVLKRTSEICLFCRLNLAPAPFLNNRRPLSSNGRSRQQGAAAAVAEEPDGGTDEAPKDDVAPSTPKSTEAQPAETQPTQSSRDDWVADGLLPHERQDREQLIRSRLAQEQRVKELEELKRKDAASAAEQARREQERRKTAQLMAQFKKEQAERRPQPKASTPKPDVKPDVKKEQTKGSRNDRGQQSRTEEKTRVTDSNGRGIFRKVNFDGTEPPGEGAKRRRVAELQAHQVEALDSRTTPQREPRGQHKHHTQQQRRPRVDDPSGGNDRQPVPRQPVERQQRRSRVDDPFARNDRQHVPKQPVPHKPVEKVAMPAFGGSVTSAATGTRPTGDGWGIGPVQRASLVYNGAPVVQNDSTVEDGGLPSESQDNTAPKDLDALGEADAPHPSEQDAAFVQPGPVDHAVEDALPDRGALKEPPPGIFASEDDASNTTDDAWGSGAVPKAPLTYNDDSSARDVDQEIANELNASQYQAKARAAEAESQPAPASFTKPDMDNSQSTETEPLPSPSSHPAYEQGQTQIVDKAPDVSSELKETAASDHVQVKPADIDTHQAVSETEPSPTPATEEQADSVQSDIDDAQRQPQAEQRHSEPMVDEFSKSMTPQQITEPIPPMPGQQQHVDPFMDSIKSRWPTFTAEQRLQIANIMFGGTEPAPAPQVQPSQQPAGQQPQNPVYKEAWQRSQQRQQQQQQQQQQQRPSLARESMQQRARRPTSSEDWDAPSPVKRNGSGWGLDEQEIDPPATINLQSDLQPTQSMHRPQQIYRDELPQPGETGYYATMFDPQEVYQQQQSRADDDVSANWQHLRRQDRQSPPSQQQKPAAPPSQPLESQPEEHFSSDMVDRMFQKHRESRAPPQQPSSPAQPRPTYDNPFAAPQVPQVSFLPYNNPSRAKEDIVCGRCQQKGHHARDCRGPILKQQEWRPQGQGYQRQQRQQTEQQRDQLSPFRNEHQQRSVRQDRSSSPFHEVQSASRASNPFAPEPSGSGRSRRSIHPFATEHSGADDVQQFSKAADRVERRAAFAPLHEISSEKPTRKGKFRDEDDADQDFDRPARKGRFRAAVQDDDDAMSDIANRVLRRQSKFADEDDEIEERGGRSRDQGRKTRGRQRDDDDEDDDAAAAREERNLRKRERQAREREARESKAAEKKARQEEERSQLKLPEFISVSTLAQTLGVRYEAFVRRLERLGYDDIFPGKVLNSETSGMIAMEYDYDPVFEPANEADERDLKARPEPEDKHSLPVRPPVVTIMGHVDHGKTTILDYLRKSSVAAGEAGGITQHIGAFSVPLASSGKTITFLDTPGHAAFLAMRQRGANVTDMVILVVAADDSVKPQTLEALKHAQAAKVPIIVAVNKIDKPETDLQRVKQDLARHGVEIEDFGGETQVVPVSGKTGEGMDMLEENIVTLSEILDHRAETDGPVEGWVLEATTKKLGRVATVLVRRGTLKTGTVIVAGRSWARVRSLHNELGQAVEKAGPGIPVEVDGWRDQPIAGDEVLEAPTEQKATDVVEYRLEKVEREKTAVDMEAINDARKAEQEKREKERAAQRASRYAAYSDFFEAAADPGEEEDTAEPQEEKSSGPKSVPFIIKADVSGSAEAVSAYILSISSPLILPCILKSEVGSINPSDVELAAAAQGHIVAFNLPPDEGIKGTAEARGVKVLENNVIYRVLDDVKAVLEEMLPPVITQRVLGEAEIGQAFEIGIGGRKKMKIAGCKVRNGVVGKNHKVRVMRGGEKVYDGTMSSLKNVKKDVQEMRKGTECGMGFDDWEQFEVGDQIQTYEEVSEKRKL